MLTLRTARVKALCRIASHAAQVDVIDKVIKGGSAGRLPNAPGDVPGFQLAGTEGAIPSCLCDSCGAPRKGPLLKLVGKDAEINAGDSYKASASPQTWLSLLPHQSAPSSALLQRNTTHRSHSSSAHPPVMKNSLLQVVASTIALASMASAAALPVVARDLVDGAGNVICSANPKDNFDCSCGWIPDGSEGVTWYCPGKAEWVDPPLHAVPELVADDMTGLTCVATA